jgi:hypothetical protein
MLTQNAIKKINNVGTRLKIAIALGVSEQTIIRYISENHENLTKAAALKVIREETSFTDEEILEDSKITA